MVPKGYRAIKRCTQTLLVANVSTECLGNCGVVFYRTDLLGKRCTRCAIAPFLHCKVTKPQVMCCHHLWKCKSNKTFSV